MHICEVITKSESRDLPHDVARGRGGDRSGAAQKRLARILKDDRQMHESAADRARRDVKLLAVTARGMGPIGLVKQGEALLALENAQASLHAMNSGERIRRMRQLQARIAGGPR